jgi:hypothetical protein
MLTITTKDKQGKVNLLQGLADAKAALGEWTKDGYLVHDTRFKIEPGTPVGLPGGVAIGDRLVFDGPLEELRAELIAAGLLAPAEEELPPIDPNPVPAEPDYPLAAAQVVVNVNVDNVQTMRAVLDALTERGLLR